MKEKVILAYSGGLDTTAIIPWLKENFDYEVICVCIDCGQAEELDGLEAVSYTHLDVYKRQPLVRECVPTFSVIRNAPTGTPHPSALAVVMMSGFTP